jgi:hypothetical protein
MAKAFAKGDYCLSLKPQSATAEWWTLFDRIQDKEKRFLNFPRYRCCCSFLSYDSKRTGTSSLSAHAKSCRFHHPTLIVTSRRCSDNQQTLRICLPKRNDLSLNHSLTCVLKICDPLKLSLDQALNGFVKLSLKSDEGVKIISMIHSFYLSQRLFHNDFNYWRRVRESKSSAFVLHFFIWKKRKSFS